MPIRVFHRDEFELQVPLISSDARMIVWPGTGAWDATMNYVRMQPGEENTVHSHRESEDTIVIIDGFGSVEDLTNGIIQQFEQGDVIHVPLGVSHRVLADRGSHVVSVGGPCPADLALLKASGADITERGS
jgi:quercetin dioxygenase-like cupin family protein